MEKNVYIAPEASVELLNEEDLVLVSVDTVNVFDIDNQNSVSWNSYPW